MWNFPIALTRTVQRNKTQACGEHRGVIERSNTTHNATRWAKGVQKWRKTATYLPKSTVTPSVLACFAVQHIGACQTTSWEG
jgi:hypothetical protein